MSTFDIWFNNFREKHSGLGWLIWAICTHYRHIDEYYEHRDGIFTNIFCWPVLSVIFLVMILYIEAQAFMLVWSA